MLNEIGEPFQVRKFSTADRENYSPEYLAVNPKGRIPALLIDGFTLPRIRRSSRALAAEGNFRQVGGPLAILTYSDYDVVMSAVRIADLKSHLSAHLRKVRAGRTITVLDRDTPIARIVPYEEHGGPLNLRPPLPEAPTLRQVRLPPPLRLRGDILEILLEERQVGR